MNLSPLFHCQRRVQHIGSTCDMAHLIAAITAYSLGSCRSSSIASRMTMQPSSVSSTSSMSTTSEEMLARSYVDRVIGRIREL